MSKPIISITNFSNGILSDSTENVSNGGQSFVNCNIHHTDSTLQASQKLTQETDVFTDLVKWFVYDEGETTYKYWALGDTGNLYKTTAIGGTWILDSNKGGHGNGLALYNGERFYCTDTGLVGDAGTSKTLDSDTLWHPMAIYLGSLFIGAGRYLAKLESDGTFTARALTLPEGQRIKSLRIYQDKLCIGTWMGTNIYDVAEATLFTWDGTTTFPEQSFSVQEYGMNALELWENILLCFAGIAGNIYAYNGAFLDKCKQIPNVEGEIGNYVYTNPGATSSFRGNILVGFSIGSGDALGGTYELGRKTEDLPFAMTLPYLKSSGETDVNIGAVFAGGNNEFLVSWKDNVLGTYGVDRLDITTKKTGGYFEGQCYEIMNGDNERLVKGISVVAEPLPTGTSLTIEYKCDYETSWQSAGTITSSNQEEILYFPVRCKVFQPRIEINTSGNNSPKIKRIEIY